MSSNTGLLGGTDMMSRMDTMFSWLFKWRSNFNSLRILLASTMSMKVSLIFLMATFLPVTLSTADTTKP